MPLLIALTVSLHTALAGFNGIGAMPQTTQDNPRTTLADGSRAIRVQAVVAVPAAEAWRLWTTSGGVTEFLGVANNIELRPGGPFELYFAPDAPEGERGSDGCTILGYLPHRWLSFSWNAPPSIPAIRALGPCSQVSIEFGALDTGHTRVTLTHHGFREGEAWDKKYDYFMRAWPSVMTAFSRHIAQRKADDPVRNKSLDPAPYRAAHCYLFVGFTRPDLFETLTTAEQDTFARHFAYLQKLTREGKVILAGPCTDIESDNPGPGIVIVATGDEAEARRIMENDPAVTGGLFKAELHLFRVSLLREWDRAPISR